MSSEITTKLTIRQFLQTCMLPGLYTFNRIDSPANKALCHCGAKVTFIVVDWDGAAAVSDAGFCEEHKPNDV